MTVNRMNYILRTSIQFVLLYTDIILLVTDSM